MLADVHAPSGTTNQTVLPFVSYVYQTEKRFRYCWLIATPQPFWESPPHQRSPYVPTGVGFGGPKSSRVIDLVPEAPLIV